MATINVTQSFGSDLLGFLQDVLENYTSTSSTSERKTYTGPDGSSYVTFRGEANVTSPGQKTVDTVELVATTIGPLGESSAISLGEIIGFSLPVADVLAAAFVSPQAFLNLLGDITFNGNAGRDIVTLGGGNDALHLSGGNDEAHGGAGNDLLEGWSGNDILYGDAGNDLFYGNTGNDRIYGGDGDDTVHAAEDNDYIDGGAGADTMHGGTGSDTFVVAATGDKTIELAGQGTDTVQSSINWTLADNVERLLLIGAGNLNGTGNALNNTIAGNAASNILNGAGGDDYMVGGAGNDIYYVSSTGDQTIEAAGGGTDTVRSYVNWTLAANVERLELLGAGNLNGVGNSLANTIAGTTGSNFINGAAGSDYLVGGAGNDTFFFNTALGTTNIDTIADYNVAQDTIRLENGIFTALVGTGTPTAAQFVKNASGTATDANDRIIYETDTGKLFYDSNGSAAGGQVQFAKLAAGLALTASDFFIV